MKHLALSIFVAAPALLSADLVAWFPLNGSTKDRVRGTQGELEGDARMSKSDRTNGLDVGGHNGVMFAADSPQFILGPSFSVSAQVWIRELPKNGTSPAGQIVFRGDDRGGLDNYSLSLGNDGFYSFTFFATDSQYCQVRYPSRLNNWATLLGTFDARTGHMVLYVDGYIVAETYTPLLPFTTMETAFTPGFSIGNVQNPLGGYHNQPFNGLIRNVKLFNTAVGWDEAVREPRETAKGDAKLSFLDSFFN